MIFLPAIPEALQKYNLEEMQPIEARDFEFSVNLKVSLENALITTTSQPCTDKVSARW